MKTLIFDTEANGESNEEICQLSYLIVSPDGIKAKNFFFAVEKMNPFAQKVHHFSKRKLMLLSNGKQFKDRASDIIDDFASADLLIGHNVSSDIQRITDSFKRAGFNYIPTKSLCTMKHYRNALHLRGKTGKKKPPRLDELCSYLHVTHEEISRWVVNYFKSRSIDAHDARYDVIATYLCVIAAVERGDLKGVF